ncbi:MAG: hypothetical protein VKL41_02295 [Snowella sp.]|nr:hypothetical protein [Snowella sp.]
MSISSRPYKSRLFNFVNRRSLQFRDRIGETFRHLKVAAEWGAQLLISPLYWIFQPRHGAREGLGTAASNQALSPADTYLSDPPVDQPLAKILTAIEPWFELPDSSSLATPFNDLKPDHSPRKKEIVLSAQFFQQIQQQLETPAPSQNLALPPAIAPQNSNPRPLGNLVSQIKNIFAPTQDLVIRGISCVIENRQLVLTTADNEILDVLSLEQQTLLKQSIRAEMANYWYERRLQWSMSQKMLGFIPLVDEQTEKVLPPVQLLWQTLHWLESQNFRPKLPQLNQSALVPATSLAPGSNAIIQKLDQRVAALEIQENKFGQQLFQQFNQGLQSVRHSAVVESSLEKTGQIIQKIDFPHQLDKINDSPQLNQLKRLNAEFLERISEKLTQTNLGHAITSLKNSENQLATPNAIEAIPPDPFQIQVLIQAAIVYFFGQKSAHAHLSGQNGQSLVSSTESMDDPWLTWEDLFIDRSTEINIETSTATNQSLPLRGMPKRTALKPSQSGKIQKKSRKNSKINRSTTSKSSQRPLKTSTATLTETPVSSDLDTILEEEVETALMATTSQETGLDAAPDWIETEARVMGYHKHPLEQILEFLDIFMLWLEESLKKIWYWLRNRLASI